MRERIFAEYKKAYEGLDIDLEDAGKIRPIIDAINVVSSSAIIARKEGLLSLEEYVSQMDSNVALSRFYNELIMLVVDGTDSELVEEISLYKLISFGLTDVEKVAGIIYLLGGLSIQQGENPRVLEQKLRALVPLRWRRFLESEHETNEIVKKLPDESLEKMLEAIEGKGSPITPEKDGYFVVRLTEQMVKNLDDRSVQRLLRDVDNLELEVAMKGMEGAAVVKFLKNTSKRLALMLLEDMRFMGPVKMQDVAHASQTILLTAMKLMESAEIVSSQYEFLKGFFANIEADGNKTNIHANELRNLLDEYDAAIYGTVE
jgi:hypothetical protein